MIKELVYTEEGFDEGSVSIYKVNNNFEVWIVPLYGGEEQYYKTVETLAEAIDCSNQIT